MSNCLINTATLEFPIYEDVLRSRLNIESKETALPENYVAVEFETAPEVDSMTHILEAMPPKFFNDKWIVQWEIKELTEAQKLELRDGPSMQAGNSLNNIRGEAPNVIG